MPVKSSNYSRQYLNSFLILTFCAMTLIPVLFLNFDSHHDGLIVQTVLNLKDSIQNNSDWPYNQYGSFWIFIFTFGTWFLPTDLVLLGIRIITLICYWISGWLLYKITEFYSTKKLSAWTVVYLFISHPFYGGWNSSFLPWPSAIAMPLILSIFWLLVRYEIKSQSDNFYFKANRKSAVLIGLLSSMLLGTRLQIGILLILFIFLYFWFSSNRIDGWIVMLTLLISVVIWSIIFMIKGWLIDALVDALILPSTFLSGDRIHYPFPSMTLLLSISLAMGITACLKFKSSNLKKIGVAGFFLAIPLFVFGMYKLNLVQNQENNAANYIALLQRKIMAGLLFGSLLSRATMLAAVLLKSNKKILIEERKWILLMGFSVIAAFQSWPFFDQMHIWWGSVPGVIVVVVTLNKIRIRFNFKFEKIVILPIATILLLLIPLSTQLFEERKELRSFGLSNIYGLSRYEVANRNLKEFFRLHIPNESSVLNLCPNPDVYFVDSEYYQVNRFPVYWSTFSRIDSIQNQFEFLDPRFIVTCVNAYYDQNQTDKYLILQEEIIKKQNVKYELKSIHERDGFYWKIYFNK